MEIAVPLLLFAFAIVGGVIVQRRGRRSTSAGLAAAADELGGRSDGTTLHCRVREIDVTVDRATSGAVAAADVGGQPLYWTRFRLEFAPWTVPVEMSKGSLGAKLDSLFDGTRDSSIGVRDFDDVVRIVTDDASAVRDALGTERRQIILGLLDSPAPNEVTESTLVLHVHGDQRKNPEVVVSKINEFVELAHRLVSAPAQNPPRH